MTIGTPVALGSANAASGSLTLALTTTADSPAGATIIVFIASGNTATINSVTDSAGNVYTAGNSLSSGSTKQNIFWCIGAFHLGAGGTITGRWAASTGSKMLGATSVTGILAKDQEPIGTTGTSASPFIATTALSWPYDIIFGQVLENNGAADTSGFEDINFVTDGVAANGAAMRWAWRIVHAADAITYAPVLGIPNLWAAKLIAFMGDTATSLCILPPTPSSKSPVILGYQQQPTNIGLITCALLGATEYRIGINAYLNYSPGTSDAIALAAMVTLCTAAGIKIVPDIKYNPPGLPGGYSGTAPTDLAAYAQNLGFILDILGDQVAMVCIENEVNGNFLPVGTLPPPGGDYATYYAAVKQVADDTAAAYFGELAAAATICEARGVPITHSGVSDTGLTRAYEVALINSGDLADATEFINTTSTGANGTIPNDLPNTAFPSRPIFANNPGALYSALISASLIEFGGGYGAQFCNLHAFWSLPDICWEYRALAWARDLSGQDLVLTAVGQRTDDPAATTAITKLIRLLQPVRFSIFGGVYGNKTFPYANVDGSLTAIGGVVKSAFASYVDALNPPRFGMFCSGPEYLRLGRNLGVQYQRLTVNNTAGALIGAPQAAAIRDAGMGINLILNNASSIPSVPPPSIPIYQAQVAAILDNIKPDLVNIQIEVDAGVFYQPQATPAATAAAYLAQLTAAADVCHSTGAYAGQNRHYLIGDSGISSSGTNFAFWNYLWGLGDHSPGNAADVFKAVAFVGPSQGTDGTDARNQVPDADHPTRGIFASAGQADRLTQLTLVNLLLAGLAATGIDYINIHAFWYFEDFTQKQKAIQWVIDTVGLPAMTNAWGQRDRDPQTTRAMYQGARDLGMHWLFWYSVFQKKAQDPGDQDGDLTILGTALRDAANPFGWRLGHSAMTPLTFTGRSASMVT